MLPPTLSSVGAVRMRRPCRGRYRRPAASGRSGRTVHFGLRVTGPRIGIRLSRTKFVRTGIPPRERGGPRTTGRAWTATARGRSEGPCGMMRAIGLGLVLTPPGGRQPPRPALVFLRTFWLDRRRRCFERDGDVLGSLDNPHVPLDPPGNTVGDLRAVLQP